MKKAIKFTIGADPEVTVLDDANYPVCAFNLLKGTKAQPESLGETGFYCLWDNVNAEFLVPPSSSFKAFSKSITTGLDLLKKRLDRVGNGLVFSNAASSKFTTNQLASKFAMEFGCDPDYNAWTLEMNEPPANPKNIRSAGGHVHIGYKNIDDMIRLVRSLDIFLGVPSVLLDDDKRRRDLYGKAGCFRDKPYGVEYRVLSNFWIFNPTLHKFVYDGVKRAIAFHHSKESEILMTDVTVGVAVQRIINDSNKDLAAEHNKLWGIKLPKVA